MSLDVHRARTFAEVVRLGSVAAAADALGYTPSAVSQQLSTLERDIGLTLVDRGHRPLVATPAGAELLPEVHALLARAVEVDAAIDDLRGVRRGHVEVVAFASAVSSLLPPALASFRAAHPAVGVGVTVAEPDEALVALRSGAADVALVFRLPEDELDDDAALARAAIAQDPLHLALAPGHPLAGRAEVTPAQLAGEPLVVPRPDGPAAGFRTLVERIVGSELRIAYEFEDTWAAQAFAAAGLAAAMMHGLILTPPHPGVVVRPVASAQGVRTVEVVRVSGRRVPAARALWEALARSGR
jgi:DNA-binding transcriptional LysR family regulator